MKAAAFFKLVIFLLITPLLRAEVNFGGLDLSDDSRLLFTAESRGGGPASQNALFLIDLGLPDGDRKLNRLTAFPERIELLADPPQLQVNNVFGIARLPLSGGLPRELEGYRSFAAAKPLEGGRTPQMAASPDGKWLLSVRQAGPASGDLYLSAVAEAPGQRRLIAQDIDGEPFPAVWSPNSRFFIYRKGGKLYYYPLQADVVDERFRLIGGGAISSIAWDRDGEFFYVRENIVYRVRGRELFARSIYTDFLDIGSVAGKLPINFDPVFDDYWIDGGAQAALVRKGDKNVFYCPLTAATQTAGVSLPYITLPWPARVDVIWPQDGALTVTAIGKSGGKPASLAWRLTDSASGRVFSPLQTPVFSGAALSPDGNLALVWGSGGLELYDYRNWKTIETLSNRPVTDCIWVSANEAVAAGPDKIERLRFRPASSSGSRLSERSLICISGVEASGFDEAGRVLALSDGVWYATDGKTSWQPADGPLQRKPSVANGQYRTYLEKQESGFYANMPMLRNTASVGTQPLIPPAKVYKPVTADKDSSGAAVSGLFSHGSRTGPRQVALCFDLYDDSTGLHQALDALDRFGYKATFFLNGECIRRDPAAARSIAEAGHEAASMFYAPIRLADARYQISGSFISRGLARNEDDYYAATRGAATGSELALIWHPPWYNASQAIVAQAAASGYRTTDRDIDPEDWLSVEDAHNYGLEQHSVRAMITGIVNKALPGSIIPIRLGLLPGGREGNDYLFLKIDLILDALTQAGYTIVPVSALMPR